MINEVIFFGLILLVAIAPLPLGSNRPLPAALIAVFAALLLLLWSVRTAQTGVSLVRFPRRLYIPFGFFVLVCVWIGVQSASGMPQSITDPSWQVMNTVLGTSGPSRISVNPNQSLSSLMHLTTYGVIFWLAVQTTRTPERANTALIATMTIGGIYALYGLAVFLSGNEWILIYRKWAYPDALTSTFVNRNSFATFAGLSLICTVSIFLDKIAGLLTLKRVWREKLILLVEHIVARSAWTTVCLLSITIALVLTGSRAGNVATLIAISIFLGFTLYKSGLRRRHMLIIGSLFIAVFSVAAFTSSGLLGQRLANNDTILAENDRLLVYENTLSAIASSPWTGTGFGTFENVFPAYRTSELPIGVLWDRAHSTYLENALGLGLPAAAALNISILLIAAQCLYGVFVRRRDRKFSIIGVAATVLVGLHSVVDFSLEIPAVSVLYAFILGFATSQSWRTGEHR
jgi:O-antigen ligase